MYNYQEGFLSITFLQMEKFLENPTKYHMIESQRKQVQDYMYEGSAPPNGCLALSEMARNGEPASAPALTGANTDARRLSDTSWDGRGRLGGPLSPGNFSSAATSPSEYAPSEVIGTAYLSRYIKELYMCLGVHLY